MGSFLMSWNFTLLYENSCYCTYKMMNTYYKKLKQFRRIKTPRKMSKTQYLWEKKIVFNIILANCLHILTEKDE